MEYFIQSHSLEVLEILSQQKTFLLVLYHFYDT